MKKLLLAFVLLSAFGKAQLSCNQSTFTPNKTYTTGAVATHSGQATEFIYLCSNTQVNDTLNGNVACHWIIVNTGSDFWFKVKNCAVYIYALGTSTVHITATSVGGASSLYIIKEPTATIINASTLTANTTTCSAIITPSINCSGSSGINELSVLNTKINAYPNPASDKMIVETLWGNSFNGAEVSIINLLGSVVYDKKAVGGQKLEIDLKDLQSGVYYLSVNSNSFKETRKIIVSK